MSSRSFPVLGIVLTCLLASAAQAQRPQLPPPAAESEVPVQAYVLQLNKSRVIDLPIDARDVLVTAPAIADVVVKTPRRIFLLGKEVGETNAYFFDRNGKQILRLDVRVEMDLGGLRSAFGDLLPGERIAPKAVNQSIALTGRVRSARVSEDARAIARRFVNNDANILNMLKIADDQQVLLQVHISEMSRSVVKQLGINTTIGSSGGKFRVLPGPDRLTPPTGTFATLAFDWAKIFGFGTAAASLVTALEQEGLVKTLAQPNLTAVSGESAKFLAGGEFPIPVPGQDNTVTIEFKEFGVLLTFTPVVLDSGLISLRLTTEVSQLNFETQLVLLGTAIPGLTVRRTETTVEISSGGSLVIAGLLQNDNTNTVDGLPYLKDIPVLGALFRSVAFKRDETELVVAVSPYLVRPVAADAVTLPTDGFVPASDIDLYLLGRLHAVYSKPGAPPPQGALKGPVGFIME